MSGYKLVVVETDQTCGHRLVITIYLNGHRFSDLDIDQTTGHRLVIGQSNRVLHIKNEQLTFFFK